VQTIVVISTRGFGVFRHDLLVEPDQVRFVGIYSEHDVGNVTAAQRGWFAEIHTVPCELPSPTPSEASTVDVDAAREALRKVLADPAAGTVSLHCWDERNMLAAAQLRDDLDLAGPRMADILPYRDKVLMKQRLAGTGVRVPRFGTFPADRFRADREACFAEITGEVGLPFILKPIAAAAADGVYKISSWEDFAALPVDLGQPYEYEEFISGTMYSVNLISQGGRTVFRGVTEYLVNSTDVQAGRVNADINLIDSDPRVDRMVALAETVLDALGRLDGGSHLELFQTPQDELVFLEVGARYKGLAGMAAMQRNYAVALLNLSLEIEAGVRSHPWDQEQVYCYDGVIPKKPGVIAELIDPDLDSEVEMTWKVKVGDVVGKGSSLIDNGGTFLVTNKDYDVAYADFHRLATYEPIRYRPA
jgi:biotin carboxylase